MLYQWLFGEVRRYLRDNNPIRVSRSIRDLAYKAMQMKEKLTKENGKEPTIDDIAKNLGIEREEVVLMLYKIQYHFRNQSIKMEQRAYL